MSMSFLRFVGVLAFFAPVACGGDDGPLADDGGMLETRDGGLALDGAQGASDGGLDGGLEVDGPYALLYDDGAPMGRTRRRDGLGDGDSPRPGSTVRLLGSERVVMTDARGVAAFPGVADGTYLFALDDADRATTHNVSDAVVAGVERGSFKMTTFGDSLPVLGGRPTFPTELAELFAPLAEVESVNLASPGTVTDDWAVGTLRRMRLESEAPDTDLFVVSLGGNDFLAYVQALFSAGGMDAILEALDGGAETEALRILERVIELVDSLRVLAPEADFVYLVFPAYPTSTIWRDLITSSVDPSLQSVAPRLVEGVFVEIVDAMLDRLADEDLVIADLDRMSRAEPIDPLLFDELHFTTLGHRRVAEEIFGSLGGLVVGAPALELPYLVGF